MYQFISSRLVAIIDWKKGAGLWKVVNWHLQSLTSRHSESTQHHPAWFIWVFPNIGVPQNGWFTMETLLKWTMKRPYSENTEAWRKNQSDERMNFQAQSFLPRRWPTIVTASNHDLFRQLTSMTSILCLDRFKWRLLAPVKIYHPFVVDATWPITTRSCHVIPSAHRWKPVRLIMTRSTGLSFVVTFEIKEVPQSQSWDICISQSHVHIAVNDLLLIFQSPVGICLVFVPLKESSCTCLADKERFFRIVVFDPSRILTPETCRCIQPMPIRIPSRVAIEAYSRCMFQALVSFLLVGSPGQEPRWISSSHFGTGSICRTSSLMVRRAFIKPSPNHDGWVIHTGFQHLLNLLQLVLHEVWPILSVIKRHSWAQGFLPHGKASFIQAI